MELSKSQKQPTTHANESKEMEVAYAQLPNVNNVQGFQLGQHTWIPQCLVPGIVPEDLQVIGSAKEFLKQGKKELAAEY